MNHSSYLNSLFSIQYRTIKANLRGILSHTHLRFIASQHNEVCECVYFISNTMNSCGLTGSLVWTRTGSRVKQGVSACQQRLCRATAGLGCWQEGEHDVPPRDSTFRRWRLKGRPLEGDPATPLLLGCDLSCPPAAFSRMNQLSVDQRDKSSQNTLNTSNLDIFRKYDLLMTRPPLLMAITKRLWFEFPDFPRNQPGVRFPCNNVTCSLTLFIYFITL